MPTEAEVQTQIADAIHPFELVREMAEDSASQTDGDSFVDLLTAFKEEIGHGGSFTGPAESAMDSMRDVVAGLISGGRQARVLEPLLRNYAEAVGFPEKNGGSPSAILSRLYLRFNDNNDRVTSREYTFGTPGSFTGTGDGVLKRLTEDAYGFTLQLPHGETKTFRCVQDGNSGTNRHQEAFEVRGEDASNPVGLETLGSGIVGGIRTLSASDSLLRNPSFESFAGDDINNLTELTGWTFNTGSVGNQNLDETNVFRGFEGDGGTPRALNLTESVNISQTLEENNNTVSPAVPMGLALAFNREVGSGDGTLTIHLGSQSTNVAVSAQTGWNRLFLPFDTNLWYRNWQEDEADVVIDWSRNSGDLLVDDFLLVTGTLIDGSWWWLFGGETPFLREDEVSVTDSIDVEGVLQRHLVRAFGRYLPHDTSGSGNVTWADP